MRVSLFATCMVDLFEPEVAVATVHVLRAAGHRVSVPSGATCCGQPAWNSGFAVDAAKVARATLDALEADAGDAIVVPAGSCATMIKVFWPEMFEVAGDHDAAARAKALGERTHELSAFLALHGLPPMTPSPEVIAYHHSCHMLRELRVDGPPQAALAAAACDIVDWVADRRCCGFGGLFSFKLPETSEAMADDKLRTLAATGCTQLVGSDTSCLAHLRARAEHEGVVVEVRHLAQVLADRLTPSPPTTSAACP